MLRFDLDEAIVILLLLLLLLMLLLKTHKLCKIVSTPRHAHDLSLERTER
jgi:hypothetical protein